MSPQLPPRPPQRERGPGGEVFYDETLFAGTAAYYSRYRAPYPDALIGDIVAHYRLDASGRLLDLGCGPGTLTLPLASHFAEIIALDPDEGMISEAKRLDQDGRIDWRVMRAEDVSPEMGTFRLVTCGSSFHWMDRDLVLAKIAEVLTPDGGLTLASGIRPWWDGPEDWHGVITRLVKRYLGDDRKAGATVFKQAGEMFEGTLERNGWRVEFVRDHETHYAWDIDSVIGHLWSTSFAGRVHFGNRVDEFERELRAELLTLRPDGAFRETGVSGVVCGRPL